MEAESSELSIVDEADKGDIGSGVDGRVERASGGDGRARIVELRVVDVGCGADVNQVCLPVRARSHQLRPYHANH